MATAKPELVRESQEDVRNVQALKLRHADLLGKQRKNVARIGAAGVERIDASALQLLTAFSIALLAQARSIACFAPSVAM